MFSFTFRPPVISFCRLLGILLVALAICPQVRGDDGAQPRHQPDVKAWKTNREQGQKALEQKNYSQARDFFKAALAEARNFDAKDTRLAESLTDLAHVYYSTGNVAEAEPLFREVTEIRYNDPNQLMEADALFTLGVVGERLGHYDEAAKVFQQAEDILARKLGRDNPETVLCTFRRGIVYYEQQDYARAEPLLKRSFTLFRNPASKITFRKPDSSIGGMQAIRHTYRPNYAYALEAVSRLSQIYVIQKQLPEAEQCFKDALALVDEYAGKNDPEIPGVLQAMAAFYFSLNNYAAAEPVLQRLAKIQEKNLGATNEVTLATQDRLAGIYAQEKKAAEAESLYQKIIASRELASGTDSRETGVAVANLGKFYVTQGDYEKAEPLYRRQLTQVEKYQGDGVALTPILADQAVIYAKLGRDAELEAVYRREIKIYEKMFGANSPALVKPLTDCAQILRKEKRDAEAAVLEERASAIKGK
jgi:tetratricopeptide (TPR) repeat protein